MSERQIDRGRVQLAHRIVVIPWDSRQELLAPCAGKPALRAVVDAFKAVGTSRPVELLRIENVNVLAMLEVWTQEMGGYQGLPDGISDLRDGLRDDLDGADSPLDDVFDL